MILTVVYSADQDCGEAESDEGDKETLYGVLDEPQGLPRVEEELDQKGEGVQEKEGDVKEVENVFEVKDSMGPVFDSRQGKVYRTVTSMSRSVWIEVVSRHLPSTHSNGELRRS